MAALKITIADTESEFDIDDSDRESGVTVEMDGKIKAIPLVTFLNFLFSDTRKDENAKLR